MAKKHSKKRPIYNDQFRSAAIAMLVANGYPDNAAACEITAKYLNMPGRTLRRWFTGANNPPPDNLVQEKKDGLAEMFEDVVRKYLGQAANQDEVERTTGKDAVMAAAIALDKMRLLQGLPTEIVQILPELLMLAQKKGVDPLGMFSAMKAELMEIEQ